jgi:hypothetical protein
MLSEIDSRPENSGLPDLFLARSGNFRSGFFIIENYFVGLNIFSPFLFSFRSRQKNRNYFFKSFYFLLLVKKKVTKKTTPSGIWLFRHLASKSSKLVPRVLLPAAGRRGPQTTELFKRCFDDSIFRQLPKGDKTDFKRFAAAKRLVGCPAYASFSGISLL